MSRLSLSRCYPGTSSELCRGLTFRVLDDPWGVRLHHGHARVGGSKINSDDAVKRREIRGEYFDSLKLGRGVRELTLACPKALDAYPAKARLFCVRRPLFKVFL